MSDLSEFIRTKPRKILVLRHDKIGDFLVTTPLLESLKTFFPDSEVHILLSSANSGTASQAFRWCKKVYVYDKKNIVQSLLLVIKLRAEKYDIILDVLDKPSRTSGLFAKWISAKYAITFTRSDAYSKYFTHCVQPLSRQEYHICRRTVEILRPFGIDTNVLPLQIYWDNTSNETVNVRNWIGKHNTNKIVALNIAGSHLSRFWGTSNIVEFIQQFQSRYSDATIIVFATKDFREHVEEIRKNTGVVIAPTLLSFGEFASAISQTDVIITPDTSVVHLASAFHIPMVILYTHSNPEEHGMLWTPIGVQFESVITTSSNISDISPNLVLNAYEKVVSS